jgi:hypothetical protein
MTTDTLNSISKAFDILGGGVPDAALERVIWQQLSLDFAQLAVDLGPSAGWAAATGAADRTTFDTASVTTANLAKRLKALIDDLLTKGNLSA